MKLTRRFLALLLAFSMSLSMVTPAFASETETEPVVEETVAVPETEAVDVSETEAAETETEAPVTEAPVVTEAVAEIVEVIEAAVDAALAEGTEEDPIYPEWVWNAECTEATASVTVPKGESYYIYIEYYNVALYWGETHISTYTEPGVYGPITCPADALPMTVPFTLVDVTPVEGSEENPAWPEWVWNDAQTEASFTINIPAGETYYFYVAFGGMTMTVNGGESIVVNGNYRMPELHTIINDGAEEASYTVKLTALAGTMDNPAELTDAGATVELAAGSQGYFFTYTAPGTGTVTFEIGAADSEGNALGWTYAINNMTAGTYGDTQWSDSNPVVNPAEISVSEGDELQIMVNTYDPANMWAAPEGSITVTVSFAYPYGSEQNPVSEFYMGMGTIAGEAAAGATVYYSIYGIGGMTMTIEDAANLIVTVDGVDYNAVDGVISVNLPAVMGRMPVSFSVTNNGDADAAYAMAFAYPVGSMNNPAELTDAGATVELEAGSQGYYYTYTAPDAGNLTIAVSGESWTYNVNNLTTGIYGDTHWHDDDPVVDSETLTVSQGDEIQITVNTYDPANMWAAPEGSITVTVSFEYPYGSEQNPVSEFYMGMGAINGEAAAGATVHYSIYGVGGMTMTIEDAANLTVTVDGVDYNAVDGVISVDLPAVMGRMPSTFSVTNNGAETAVYAMAFEYPEGSMYNPAELTEAGATAELEAGSQGYYYTYTAPYAGTLMVTVSGESWTYNVNNMTTYVYGDTHYHDDDPVMDSETLLVAKGDEIQIMVNTYDPNNMWAAPAGDISVALKFERGGETADAPFVITNASNPTANENAAGETIHYSANDIGKMIMTVSNAADLTVTIGEDEYTADESGVITLTVPASETTTFSITNGNTEEAVSYVISFSYPEGHMENPEEVTVGMDGTVTEVTAAIEAGTQGYYYTYTATERGTLSVGIAAADSEGNELGWTYTINNLTSYVYGEQQWSNSDPVVNPAEVSVNVGDQVQIIVNTYDPANESSVPAGDVTVTLSFAPAYGSESNPITEFYMGTGTISGSAPVNASVYYNIYGVGDMIMTIEDAANLTVVVNDSYYWADDNGVISVLLPSAMGRMPVSFYIINIGWADEEYELSFSYPEGNVNNPAELTDEGATAVLEEGSQGYYYTYYATERGELSVTISAPEGQGWTYFVNNLTSSQYGDTQQSDSDPVLNPYAMDVNVGDEIQIMVNTYDAENPWTAPAGEVSVALSIVPAQGSKSSPIYANNDDGSISGVNPANTDVYYNINGISGNNLTIENATGLTVTVSYLDYSTWPLETVTITAEPDENGTIFMELPEVWGGMDVMVSNSNDEEVSYDMTFSYYPGHYMNPDVLELGETVVSLKENASNYHFYNWTATEDGYFTFAMNTAENWFYVVNNLTTGEYGEMMYSDTGAATTTIYVHEGDLIEINVNTYDPNSWSGTPAGELTFTTSLTPASYEVISGKKLTLTFLDANGKKVSGSKVNWNIDEIYVYDPNNEPVKYDDASAYVTLKNGVLTTKACGDRVHLVISASLKADATVTATYYVDLLPAATKLGIWTMSWTGEYDYPVLNNDPQIMNINGVVQEQDPMMMFVATTYPSNADTDVDWKSSNKNIATVEELEDGTVIVRPVWKANKDGSGEFKTGTVTITATAADGSGKKASFKVKMVKWANWVEIFDKDGNEIPYDDGWKTITAEAGSSVQLTAKADLNKKVTWYVYDEYVKVNKSGKLTIAANIPDNYYVDVWAEVYDGNYYCAGDCVTVIVNNDNPPAESIQMCKINRYEEGYGSETAWNEFIDVSSITSAEDVPVLTYYVNTFPNAERAEKVTWKSSKTSVAKVSAVYWDEQAGVWAVDVTPVFKNGKCATGTTTITASVDGLKTSIDLTFLRPITEMEIVPTKNTVKTGVETVWDHYAWEYVETNAIYATVGQSLSLKVVTNEGVSNNGFYWYASRMIGAPIMDVKISSSGTLTIPKDIMEETVIWVEATAKDYSNWTRVPVIVSPKAVNVHLRVHYSEWAAPMYISNTTKTWDVNTDNNWDGEPDMTMDLSALVYPFDASQDVKWTVSNKNIATIEETVNSNGEPIARLKFTDKKFGKLTVTATAQDGSKVKTSFTLNVVKSVQNIDWKEDAVKVVAAGKSLDLSKQININPSNATNKKLTWEIISENTIGATISKAGKLSTKANKSDKIEELQILVKAQDGFEAEQTLTVLVYPVQTKSVTVSAEKDGDALTGKQTLSAGSSLTVWASSNPVEGTAGAYTCKTSNAKYATVVNNGDGSFTITAHAKGSATITITSADGCNKSAKVTVAVVPAE